MPRFLQLIVMLSAVFSASAQPIAQDSVRIFQPGVISCGDYESHPALSPDGKLLCFIKCTPDINSSCTMFFSSLGAKGWSPPVVTPFSGQYYDIDPFFTADGSTVYFASNRPLLPGGSPKGNTDIWRVSRSSNGWGQPEHVAAVNSTADEYYPTLSDNGNLYFGSTRGGRGGSDIFRSQWNDRSFGVPVNLGDSINSANHEYEPFVAPDESYVLFMATKDGSLLTADLYVSYPRGSGWSNPVAFPEPINSKYTEWSPKVTRDKKYLFFSSTRSRPATFTSRLTESEIKELLHSPGNGLGDIYYMELGKLLEELNKK